ncbi:MAG: pyridoxamine 5'-phosphate oxidase family protein [Chloroflexi bacterium]|nr:pyridoxamine 5'-phosphate oxidase family protein [Chloroflexota bacterium]
MANDYDGIDHKLAPFLRAQHVFFVATAPSGPGGHVNLSPKGHDTFRIVDTRTVAYLDLTGSGVETIAHLRENGRITIMFCAFEGPPRIVRLYGRGRLVEPMSPMFAEWRRRFGDHDGVRSVIVVELDRIADSCGYGVPILQYEGERPQMQAWLDRKGPEGVREYQAEHDISIDGLPGLAR